MNSAKVVTTQQSQVSAFKCFSNYTEENFVQTSVPRKLQESSNTYADVSHKATISGPLAEDEPEMNKLM
jgi:hypothetical protein